MKSLMAASQLAIGDVFDVLEMRFFVDFCCVQVAHDVNVTYDNIHGVLKGIVLLVNFFYVCFFQKGLPRDWLVGAVQPVAESKTK